MNVTVENWSYDIDDSIVIDFEKKHNIDIPSQYRQFLIDNNVAYVMPDGFFTKHVSSIKPNERPDDELGLFRGFAHSDKNEWNLEWYIDVYVETGRISREILPIASDGASNIICIGLNGGFYGKIFLWNHESEGDLICLADDFYSFIKSLVNIEQA